MILRWGASNCHKNNIFLLKNKVKFVFCLFLESIGVKKYTRSLSDHARKFPLLVKLSYFRLKQFVRMTVLYTVNIIHDLTFTHLGSESAGLLCQLCPFRSSDPLLNLSLDGARVASVSQVIVIADSERLGTSTCARGAKLSSTICRALW